MEPFSPSRPGCPACERESQPGRTRCAWCGAKLPHVPVADAALSCPVCEGSPLRSEAREGWACRVCDRCGGLWMGWPTLQRLERKFRSASSQAARSPRSLAPARNPLEDTPFYRQCPECLRQMARRRYQRVSRAVVDVCVGHGIWLDRDELEHVLAFLESGGLARSEEHWSELEREEREEAKKIAKILRDARNSAAQ